MRVTPTQLDLWSSNMSSLYNSLEGEILRIIIKRLTKGGHENILQWQLEKMNELNLFNSEVVRELSKMTNLAETQLTQMFEETGYNVVKDIDTLMPQNAQPIPTNLSEQMRAYSNQTWLKIDNYVNQTLVTTNYGPGSATMAYQEVLNNTAAFVNSGIDTFEEAVERAVTDLADKGIRTLLTDQGGHTWSLENYTRTVIKSTVGNTYDTLRKDRMFEYGNYTVLVTSHVGSRDKCSIIQGNVVDLRYPEELPENWPYRSIYDPYWEAYYGTPGGHRGVNCRHIHVPFVPGVNTNNQPEIDPETNERVAKANETQRRLEREIIKYKKNLMVAEEIGSDQVDHWKSLIRGRQSAIRDVVSENDDYLSRNYSREKVYTPLSSLMEDFKYNKAS